MFGRSQVQTVLVELVLTCWNDNAIGYFKLRVEVFRHQKVVNANRIAGVTLDFKGSEIDRLGLDTAGKFFYLLKIDSGVNAAYG